MKRFAVVLLALLCALPAGAATKDAALSKRLATLAGDLYAREKKLAQDLRAAAQTRAPGTGAGEGIDNVLYEDVLTVLDMALAADSQNFHAHRLAAEVLFAKAYQGPQSWDVCTLLDAEDQVGYVLSHASAVAADDLKAARALRQSIDAIPPDDIPDDPSACGDEDADPAPTVPTGLRHRR